MSDNLSARDRARVVSLIFLYKDAGERERAIQHLEGAFLTCEGAAREQEAEEIAEYINGRMYALPSVIHGCTQQVNDKLAAIIEGIRQRHANPRTMSEAEMKARGEGTYCHYGDEARIREIVREEMALVRADRASRG